MALLPIQSAGQALQAASIAGSAASAVSTAFSSLLRSAIDKTPGESAAGESSQTPPEQLQANAASKPVDVAQLRRESEALLNLFHDEFRNLLQTNGIDPSGGISLYADQFGDLRIDGAHPDKKQIESLLAARPDLVRLFHAIDGRSNLLEAVERVEKAGLTASPTESIASSGPTSLLDEKPPRRFQLNIDAERIAVNFAELDNSLSFA